MQQGNSVLLAEHTRLTDRWDSDKQCRPSDVNQIRVPNLVDDPCRQMHPKRLKGTFQQDAKHVIPAHGTSSPAYYSTPPPPGTCSRPGRLRRTSKTGGILRGRCDRRGR